MSGIYIPGMEMPKSCWRCVLSQLYEKPREMLICKITHEEVLRHKIDCNCPLIPVPPHGDLIDRDAFLAEQRHLYCENCERRKGMKNGKMKFVYDIGDAPCRACGYGDVLDDLEGAPTIIQADPAEEGEG